MRRCALCRRALAAAAPACARCGSIDTTGPTSGRATQAVVRAFIVFVVCAQLSSVLWTLLLQPGRWWAWILPLWTCENLVVDSAAMFACSAGVALGTLVGPLAIAALLVVKRHRLRTFVRPLAARLPVEWQFLVPPVVATLAFGLVWAGTHFDTGDNVGLMVQRRFPAVAGLLLFLHTVYGSDLANRLRPVIRARDRMPPRIARGAALAIVALVAAALAQYQSDNAVEQGITLMVATVAYVLLLPRASHETRQLSPT